MALTTRIAASGDEKGLIDKSVSWWAGCVGLVTNGLIVVATASFTCPDVRSYPRNSKNSRRFPCLRYVFLII